MCSVGLALRDLVKDNESFKKYQQHKQHCKEEYELRMLK
jgi:hypothetical protein